MEQNKIDEINKTLSLVEIKEITNINFKPHPYCITEKHLTKKYQSLSIESISSLEKESKGKVHCGMYTSPDGEQYSNRWKPNWTKCHIPFSEHTSDKVCALKLKANIKEKDLKKELKSLIEILKEEKLDGFIFIETEEKFRVLED